MIELVGYVAIFGAGAWVAFMAGFLARHFTARDGFEGLAADLGAGCAILALWVILFIWWLI